MVRKLTSLIDRLHRKILICSRDRHILALILKRLKKVRNANKRLLSMMNYHLANVCADEMLCTALSKNLSENKNAHCDNVSGVFRVIYLYLL